LNEFSSLQDYAGLKLKPLFYSEISSSFMIYDIFTGRDDIVRAFVKEFLGLRVEKLVCFHREKSYRGKGSIDLFICFETDGIKTDVLIEVKVHDYLSATTGQISTYYRAALDEKGDEGEVYFIYLTQFNLNNFDPSSGAVNPLTLGEFESASTELAKYKKYMKHIVWDDFYQFIGRYEDSLTKEQVLILSLQRQWMQEQCKKDIESNIVEVGSRDLTEFFKTDLNIERELSFGRKLNKNKRVSLVINLAQCDEKELAKVLEVIRGLAEASNIDRRIQMDSEEHTRKAAAEFLVSLAENESGWSLLAFYASLFDFVYKAVYLQLNGTGSRGFSIRVIVQGKGIISLCTLWSNKTVEFSLKR
jgi:hypothetical protein